MTTLRKHKNTKHPIVCKRVETPDKTLSEVIEEVQCNKYTNEKNESKTCVEFEEELGLYEIELTDGGVVLVCNLCNEGFEMNDNIEKHFEDIHNKILGPNKWTSCLDRGCGICNECGLSKYD